MNTKNVLIAAGVGTVLLGSLSFAAVNGKMNRPDFSEVRTAIESNNYASLTDEAKTKITEDQFAHMVEKEAQHKAVESAIEAGDYGAFKNAMIAQIPDEAEFQKMVAAHKARSLAQQAVETAVKNNDFNAFKSAIEAQKANHPWFGNADDKTPSDDSLQKRFDTLVEYYKTNGKLPEMGKGFGPMGEGRGMWGARGPRGGHMENN